MSLSDNKVRQAIPKAKIYYLADDDGLSLKIEPNGQKSWSYRYGIKGTDKRPRIKLGNFPEYSLKAARLARDQFKENLSFTVVETAVNQTLLFADVVQQWMDFKTKNALNDHPRAGVLQLAMICMQKDILPFLGHKEFLDIKRFDLVTVIRNIEARGVKEPVKKACSYLNQLYDFAVAMGYCDYNLALGLNKILYTQRIKQHYPFLKSELLKQFKVRLHQVNAHPILKKALLVKLHTGVRTAELLSAKPEHIDLDNKIWKIPAKHVKQFRRKVLLGFDIPDYVIPLSTQVVEIMQSAMQWSENEEYIFSSPKLLNQPLHFNSLNTVIRRMGYGKSELSLHGLRSTLSTILYDSGLFQSTWIEAQLSHTDKDKTRASYNHAQYIPQRTEMMQWWSDYLDAS